MFGPPTADKPHRFTLRQLPLAARLVLTVFLIAVGLGYCSALVQLHLQHSDQDGSALPTPDNVVERFSGIRKFDGTYPKSKIESIIAGDPHGSFNKGNMAPAFFDESDKPYKKVLESPADNPKRKKLDAEREGERAAVRAFINAPADQRKAIYAADAMDPPAELKGKPITEEFVEKEKVKVASIIGERCGRCHDNQQAPNFGTFDLLEPLITAPLPEKFPYNGAEYVKSSKFITLDGLTQSTHAHLLSFAMLFMLTGLIYTFSSHPGWLRGTLGPVVLLAQVADISCWWLARLPLQYGGPNFALAIMGTGAVVGMGLMLQIVLSLFDMYRWRGRFVLAILFAIGLAAAMIVITQAVYPGLVAEKEKASKTKATPPTEGEQPNRK